ncbi:hypothetical protein BT96DRAFT_1007640 [Gymnopus androsaceus JB14]|uniref:Uncharacterized protein n=1 Tax=Gymnopus androsaceus JB14 TaxID=1447944 RepID=A0A6A4GHU9_9AGAR|nr:hypothetical protein BT96DRAFT_1007640 [Gymnopus androsaceus JB14]
MDPPPHLGQFLMPGNTASTPPLQPPSHSSTNQQAPPIPASSPGNQQPLNQPNPHGQVPPTNPPNANAATAGASNNSGGSSGLTAFWSSDELSFNTHADMEAFIAASVEAGIKGAGRVTSAATIPKSQVQTPEMQEGYIGDLFNTGASEKAQKLVHSYEYMSLTLFLPVNHKQPKSSSTTFAFDAVSGSLVASEAPAD